MKHLSDAQLAALALELAPPRAHRHLQACADCRRRLAAYEQVLALTAAAPAPEPPADFGQRVWQRLQSQLDVPAPAARRFPHRVRVWALAASLALVAGLAWRLHLRPAPALPTPVAPSASAPSPVLLQAVSQHLDRTQVLLVELAHAAPVRGRHAASAVDVGPEQRWARALLASNRLYQQNASRSGNAAMAHLLGALEPVLLEIAHSPGQVSPARWRQLQARIATSGILFQVRVVDQSLQSQLHTQESNGTL
ncbi:MAG TPA: hypothetical protein VNF74_09025 [Terriglobales bacterium]|nr:hypothetical protein [Terriglobales bacterium]